MKNRFIIYILLFVTPTLIECKHRKGDLQNVENYKYRIEILRYELGEDNYRDEYVYIGENDTVGSQYITYDNETIDSSKSNYYTLKIENKGNNKYEGLLRYHFDPNLEGQLNELNFFMKRKINGDFRNFIFKSHTNTLKFVFSGKSDTVNGLINVYHLKPAKEEGSFPRVWTRP